MKKLFDLWYVRGYHDREDTRLHIGIYSSVENAEAAIAKLQPMPGFSEWQDGFEIHETGLNQTNWESGFKSVTGEAMEHPPKEAFDLPYWPEKKSGK